MTSGRLRREAGQPAGGPADFTPFPRSEIAQSVPRRFAKMVAAHPGRPAVKTRSHAFTYAGLDALANRIARGILDRCGAGAEPIALLFEHGAPFVPAAIGVMKAGKFYVPLDRSMPRARLAALLADLQTRLIVTNGDNAAAAAELAAGAIGMLDVDALPSDQPADDPRVPVSPDDLAYIIYTSGSTGSPKGVMVDHADVLHYTMNYTNSVRYTKNDRISGLNALTSNAHGSEMYPALLNGATLCPFSIRDEGVDRLAPWLAEEGITSYGSVPAVFRGLVRALHGPARLPELRVIRLGGDRLLRSDVELFRRHFSPPCVLRNGFGSAEALLIAEYFVDEGTAVTTHVVPVGHALEDTEILILDEERRPLAFDQVGEIAVKTRFMARGYWQNPEQTAARFLAAPDGSGERIYLTGDLGRMLPDGCVFHLGRKDFQVKIRGKLVAPVEVENAMLDIPGIKDAAVVARDDRAGDTRLVAYFVPTTAPGPSVTAIRGALAEGLAHEMIPSSFVALDAMPLTGNSKIDRLALPAPVRTRPALSTPLVAPRSPVEEALAAIWSAVLDVDDVGVRDDFLELGGDSLLAAQVISRVVERYGVALPPDALLGSASVEQMAAAITRHLLERTESTGA